MTDNHWINVNGGNWSTGANWSLGAAPGLGDNALFDCAFNAGKTVTVDVNSYCKDMDWTGAANTPSFTLAAYLNIYGSVTLIAAMGAPTSFGFLLNTGTAPAIITTNGRSLATSLYIRNTQGVTFQDNLTNTGAIVMDGAGILDTNGVAVQCGAWYFQGTSTRTCYLRNSTITVTGNWNADGVTNLNFQAGTSNITVGGTTFTGAGLTYNNVTLTNATVAMSGSNTFNTLTIDRSTGNKQLTITAGTTQTVSNFVCAISGTNTLTILSSIAATAAIFAKSSGGDIILDYLSLKDNTGSPATTWYYGPNTTIVSGVTGWVNGVIDAYWDFATYG